METDKLKQVIPNLKWYEHTPCAIKAKLNNKFDIIASKGHSGCCFIKTILIQSNNRTVKIYFPEENSNELVELAYKNFNSSIDELNSEFNKWLKK